MQLWRCSSRRLGAERLPTRLASRKVYQAETAISWLDRSKRENAMGEENLAADAGREQKSAVGCIEEWAARWEEEFLAGVRSVTEEIPPAEWDGFFATFTRRHQTRLVTIEQVGPDMRYRMPAGNRPLVRIVAGTGSQGRAIRISLVKAKPADPSSCFIVSAARHVWLKRNENGVDEALEIESVDGTVTILHLRPPNASRKEAP